MTETIAHVNLDPLFRPRSVAVVGASRKRGTIGAEIFHNLLKNNFQGVIYPINVKAKFIQAVRAYSRLTDVPDPVDLAIIVVPKQDVLAVARDCVKKKVRAVVVISAGFKETGPAGKALEDQLLRVLRKGNIRLVGPNCLGILNTDPGVQMDATFAPTYPPAGNVAFSSQSGALGLTILDFARSLGIGISNFVSVGNKADVSGNDLIQYWAWDDNTDVILLYLESFGNPKRFLEIAREVSRKKPIVAVKSGRSASGARAAASHTGSLAGSEEAVKALFRQTGVIRVDTVQELFDMAMFMANQPLPKGHRVGILTNAGGPGIMAADACESWRLAVPELSPTTQGALKQLLPAEASVRNPVDMIASASPEAFRKVIPLLLKDPSIDALLVIYVPPIVTTPTEVAEAIVAGSLGMDKPILTCFMGTHGIHEGLKSLKKGNIPSYAFPEDAVAALARACEYSEWREKPPGKLRVFPDFDLRKIRTLTRRAGWLSTVEAFELLKAAGIRVAAPVLAESPEEAVEAARRMMGPVALKIDSEKILHKTEMQGVALNLRDPKAVLAAAEKMLARARAAGVTARHIRGFTVQPFVEGGTEVILGGMNDGKVGTLLMFGLGGVQVELLKDVAFRIHPVTDQDALEMVQEIKAFKLLDGYRGRPKSDVDAVVEFILRLNQLVTEVPGIVEMDLNPIKVFAKGQGAIVLDARIRLASA